MYLKHLNIDLPYTTDTFCKIIDEDWYSKTQERLFEVNANEKTEKQKNFITILFHEAGGDVVSAKKLAGYSEASSTTEVVNSLKEEILDATQSFMARNAPKAAMAMVGGLYDPTELGIKEKMSAAKELLDRTGLVKTEKMQVESTGGVMLLPPKNNE